MSNDGVKGVIREVLNENPVMRSSELLKWVAERTGARPSTFYKKIKQMREASEVCRRGRGENTFYALPENAKELDEMVGLDDEMTRQLKEEVKALIQAIQTYPYGTAAEGLAALGATTPRTRARALFQRVVHFEKANNVRFSRPWKGPDPKGFSPSESDPTLEEWYMFYLNVYDRLVRQDY